MLAAGSAPRRGFSSGACAASLLPQYQSTGEALYDSAACEILAALDAASAQQPADPDWFFAGPRLERSSLATGHGADPQFAELAVLCWQDLAGETMPRNGWLAKSLHRDCSPPPTPDCGTWTMRIWRSRCATAPSPEAAAQRTTAGPAKPWQESSWQQPTGQKLRPSRRSSMALTYWRVRSTRTPNATPWPDGYILPHSISAGDDSRVQLNELFSPQLTLATLQTYGAEFAAQPARIAPLEVELNCLAARRLGRWSTHN